MGKELQLAEVRTLAKSSFTSGLFGIKNEEQAFTLMVIAQAEGVHPIQAMQMYDVIQGRPALKATEVLSRFQKSGGKVQWLETSSKIAKAKFVHPNAGECECDYTIEDAKLAGLADKDNWKKRPKEMLRARCVSSGVRMLYPSCLNNMYSSDEVAEFEPVEEEVEFEVEVEETINVDDLKRTLANKLKKDYSFTDSMIKEFAEINNLTDDTDLLSDLGANDKRLANYVEAFEKGL